jgi:CheY-like chemotaxis protein
MVALRLPIMQGQVRPNTSIGTKHRTTTKISAASELSIQPIIACSDKPTSLIKYHRVLRILLVDDVASNRKLLKRSMENRLNKLVAMNEPGSPKIEVIIDEAADGHFAVEAVIGADCNWAAEFASSERLPASFACDPELLKKYDCITCDAQMPTMSGSFVCFLLFYLVHGVFSRHEY